MESSILYKLIILYMLDRIDEYSLTNSEISNFILDHGYTNLFNIHEALNGLIEGGFISVSSIRDTQHYKITDSGEEALLYFENRISNSIKQEILDYFKKEKINIKEESEVTADRYYNNSNEFTVDLKINERAETLLEIKFSVPTTAMADKICDEWRNKSGDVYNYLIKTLIEHNKS